MVGGHATVGQSVGGGHSVHVTVGGQTGGGGVGHDGHVGGGGATQEEVKNNAESKQSQ